MSADSTPASPFPEALVKAIKEGRLVPFVGAGVSMSVRRADGSAVFPSWEDLLKDMAERLGREQQPEAALVAAFLKLRVPNLMEAARHAREGFGGQWVEVLEGVFAPDLSGVPAAAFALPKAVWGLGANLVVTTNYDKVLQRAAPDPHGVHTVGISPPKVGRLATGAAKPTVWHLHGHIGEPHQIVLTPDSYQTLYPDGPGTAETAKQHEGALTVLRSMLGSWTFLFVGFSMADAAFVRQLEWLRDTFPGAHGPHYVLVKKSEAPALLAVIQVKGLDVRPVVFEDFGAPTVQVLADLAAAGGRAAPPPASGHSSSGPASGESTEAKTSSTSGGRGGSMDRKFTQDELLALVDAAVDAGLYSGGNRDLHFVDLPRSYWANLPEKPSPRDAVFSDLCMLNDHEKTKGYVGRPIQAWLAVAWRRASQLPQADVFARFLMRRPGANSAPVQLDEPASESHIAGDEDLRAELERHWAAHPQMATLVAEAVGVSAVGGGLPSLVKVLALSSNVIVRGVAMASRRALSVGLMPFFEFLSLAARWLAQRDARRQGGVSFRWPQAAGASNSTPAGTDRHELPLRTSTLIEVYVAAMEGRPPSFKPPASGEDVQAEGTHQAALASAVDAGLIDFKQVARATVFSLQQREQLEMTVMRRIGRWKNKAHLGRFRGWLGLQERDSGSGKPSWYVVFDGTLCLPDDEELGASDALWNKVREAFAECMSQLTLYRVRGGLIDETLEHMIAYAMTEMLRRQMETKP